MSDDSMTAAEQIKEWANVADRERRWYNLLAHEAFPKMADALQAVLVMEGPHGVSDYSDYAEGYHHALQHAQEVIAEALGVET